MKLDIIAQIVQILKDAPEVGAIEIRRGLFGAWSSVRVSKAGHGNTLGTVGAGGHIIVSQPAPAGSSPASAAPPSSPATPPSSAGPQLLQIQMTIVGTVYPSAQS